MGFTLFSALGEQAARDNSKMPDININSVRNVLKALEENWFKSDDEVALKCAHLLKSALSEEINEVPHLTKCSPPGGLCMEAKDRADQGLMQTLYMSWNGLGWTVAPHFKPQQFNLDERIKEARLIGPYGPIKSDAIDVKISYVSPHTLVPRHSEEAAEMLQILEGDEIQIGLAADDWLEHQKYNYFPPTHPKVVKTAENHFVAISVHFGKVNGKLWLNDEISSDTCFTTHTPSDHSSSESVEQYFDNVCHKFESAMRYWGYCMPELLSAAIIDQVKDGLSTDGKIVDLGCGDGAVGEALLAKGFTNLEGLDISQGMLDIAKEKGIYQSLQKVDLLQELPLEQDTFDLAVSSAVSTYLDHSALSRWVPLVKKGGYFAFVHKASVWPKWTEEQDRLETSGVWRSVWTSKPLPFLPSLDGSGSDKAKIFIFQKL